MFKNIASKAKNLFKNSRVQAFCAMLAIGSAAVFAQDAAGNYQGGTDALTTVTTEIANYIPFVVRSCLKMKVNMREML